MSFVVTSRETSSSQISRHHRNHHRRQNGPRSLQRTENQTASTIEHHKQPNGPRARHKQLHAIYSEQVQRHVE